MVAFCSRSLPSQRFLRTIFMFSVPIKPPSAKWCNDSLGQIIRKEGNGCRKLISQFPQTGAKAIFCVTSWFRAKNRISGQEAPGYSALQFPLYIDDFFFFFPFLRKCDTFNITLRFKYFSAILGWPFLLLLYLEVFFYFFSVTTKISCFLKLYITLFHSMGRCFCADQTRST